MQCWAGYARLNKCSKWVIADSSSYELLPRDELNVDYVREWFVAVGKRIDHAAPRVGQNNVHPAILNKLKIPVRFGPLQNGFSARITQIRHQKRGNRRLAREVDGLFNSLAQRAIREEL